MTTRLKMKVAQQKVGGAGTWIESLANAKGDIGCAARR